MTRTGRRLGRGGGCWGHERVIEGQDEGTAYLLLQSAEDLGLDPGVVRTSGSGFVVPAEVYEQAFPERKAKARRASK